MLYNEEDIADLKDNIINYPGIEYLGDVSQQCTDEILTYWRPTIGLFKGFKQIDINQNFSEVSQQASKLLWQKLGHDLYPGIEFLASVNNHKNWLNIKLEKGVNIIDAFELYEDEVEIVAIDKERSLLFAAHTEYRSTYDQLWLFYFNITRDNSGKMQFIRG